MGIIAANGRLEAVDVTTLSAAAARRTMEARRCLAAGSAAVLCMLWLFGAGGLHVRGECAEQLRTVGFGR